VAQVLPRAFGCGPGIKDLRGFQMQSIVCCCCCCCCRSSGFVVILVFVMIGGMVVQLCRYAKALKQRVPAWAS
jgi:hypothetical protein